MTSKNVASGADIPQAMTHLHRAGLTAARIAGDLGLTVRTITRWAAGTQRPNRRNFNSLRRLATNARDEINRKRFTSQLEQYREELLFEALTALETSEERARVAELVARLNQPVAPAPRRSAFADVDPFVLAGAAAEPALPF